VITSWKASVRERRRARASKLEELTGENGAELVLDLRGLTFMDSTGLRVLVQTDANARRDGQSLQIVRGPAAIDRLLELSGLDEVLPLVDAPPAPPS
jgi:anti-anti-sigma factor